MTPSPERLRAAVAAARDVADAFLARLAAETADAAGGVTRDSYGAGENRAHAILGETAAELGLDLRRDAACNSYATLAGADPAAPGIVIGSHLDSVPRGGNFDGAAGVAAGLAVCAALHRLGVRLPHDVTVMAIRAEESIWFPCSYIGSRAALGRLPDGALDRVRRADTGRSLAEHVAAAGGNVTRLRSGQPLLDPAGLRAYVEVHIEQAPVLFESGLPLGICTGIPGNFRYPRAQIIGRDDHVGTPRRFRRDASRAGAALAMAMDERWEDLEGQGVPVAVTFGRFHTDSARHGMTVVPGRFDFSLDVRAYDPVLLDRLEAEFHRAVEAVEAAYRVDVVLGERTSARVGTMDPQIIAEMSARAEALGIAAMLLGSPGSHDAAAFADAGVPTAMLLLRNENGSHNPDERMEIDDLLAACLLLADWICRNGRWTAST
jgi:beta-ureidopropionase / N-carbamoyl-L-amino-acid hydrolase